VKFSDGPGDLVADKHVVERAYPTIDGMSDHTVSQSLYLRDPDGNEVELYVDADESVWKDDPAAVLSPIKPLHL
jgi:catechol 2,3-dioxygenase